MSKPLTTVMDKFSIALGTGPVAFGFWLGATVAAGASAIVGFADGFGRGFLVALVVGFAVALEVALVVGFLVGTGDFCGRGVELGVGVSKAESGIVITST